MTALVSVVIPTFNRAADLRRALASIVAQTWQHWEVLVVDNHSSDDTQAVVAAFADPRIRFLSVHNHGVIAVSRNLGIREARGEYLAFLDSDDWWLPVKLQESVRVLESGADLVYHDLLVARPRRSFWSSQRAATWQLRAPAFDDLLKRGNAITNSSVVVRRSLLLAIGGLSEEARLTAWEDYDCWLRIAQRTEKFVRIATPLGYYWVGANNMSSPERTVSNLGRIREIYLAPRGFARDADVPAWLHYSIGRAHYRLHAYRKARVHMGFAIRGKLPAAVRIRALLTFAGALARR